MDTDKIIQDLNRRFAAPLPAARRQALLKRLDLPEHLTANGLLEALNLLYSREEVTALLETL